VAPAEWEEALGWEIDHLSRAPFFVLHPEALVAVRDELQRIRPGRGTDLKLEEDDDIWAVVDIARRLDAQPRYGGASMRLAASSSVPSNSRGPDSRPWLSAGRRLAFGSPGWVPQRLVTATGPNPLPR
jgi:hypothetical protein